ncbi:hypothetical protein ABEF95_012273 [Exophiala dermatitidis]
MQDTVGVTQIELKPCLAELLRTCIYPPGLLLKVEHVFNKARAGSHKSSGDGRAARATDEKGRALCTPRPLQYDTETESSKSRCLHLALSDGILQIQAVFAKQLHNHELLNLQKGDILELSDYQLRIAARTTGQGKVIYFGIQHCVWVGREETTKPELESEGGFFHEDKEMAEEAKQGPGNKGASERAMATNNNLDPKRLGKRCREIEYDNDPHRSKRRQTTNQPVASGRSTPSTDCRTLNCDDDDSEEEYFGTLVASQSQVEERRLMLRHSQQCLVQQEPKPPDLPKQQPEEKANKSAPIRATTLSNGGHEVLTEIVQACNDPTNADLLSPSQPEEVKEVQDNEKRPTTNNTTLSNMTSTAPSYSATAATTPLHTLASLLNPANSLPPRNYSCTILCVISWVSSSLIHKPNTPFPPKRHVKVHDPSVSHRQAGITVAVFVNAKNFIPKPGTVALLKDVVMQRCGDDVILNKYASFGSRMKDDSSESPDQDHGKGCGWFISDQQKLLELGFDVHGIKKWWQERTAKKKRGSAG